MTLKDNLSILKKVDLNNPPKLKENEFLLKVKANGIGFMAKLNKDGSVPKVFNEWGDIGFNVKLPTYIITESYRSGWKFVGLRHGKSAAWVTLKHAFGFTVEINKTAFEKIANKITMVNGLIVTPCYFKAALKNAELLVNENDAYTMMYQIQQKISENIKFKKQFRDLIIDNFPEESFEVLI